MAGPEPKLVLSVAALTDTGRVRDHNEDFVLYHVPPEPETLRREGALFLVCDGVGGGAAGEVASEHASRRILADYFQPENGIGPHAKLLAAVQRANSEIYAENLRAGGDRKMATTVVAALVIGDQLSLAHAGDSRAYLVRGGHISQLTKDHSWVAEMVQAGDLSEAEAENHPWRNRITRSLGVAETVKLDTQSLALQANDVVVLCSDGLIRHVKDAEIGAIVSNNPPATAADQLIQLANSRGGSDNITALVVRVQVEDLAPTERAVAPPALAAALPTPPAPLAQAAPVVAARGGRPWVLYAGLGAVLVLVLAGVAFVVVTRLLRPQAADATPLATVVETATAAETASATLEAEATPTPQPVSQAPVPAGTVTAQPGIVATITAAATDAPDALATVAAEIQGTVIVGDGVWLRVDPSVDAEVVMPLKIGTTFFVRFWTQQERGQCDSGIWLGVDVAGDISGWICGDNRFVRVMDRPVSVELLEQLGLPETAVPAEAPTATPTPPKSKTEAPAPLVLASLSISLPDLKLEPVALPAVEFQPLALPEVQMPDLGELPCVCFADRLSRLNSPISLEMAALSLPAFTAPGMVELDLGELRLCCS